jgi:DNA-binding YbaB/EbfC family protein
MDFMKMMKQAKEMQSKMADMQSSIATLEVSGASGGGLVSVTVTGGGALAALKIDPSLMQPGEQEILEDLIVAAHADARGKLEVELQKKMSEVTGGLQLPPGMKLPF